LEHDFQKAGVEVVDRQVSSGNQQAADVVNCLWQQTSIILVKVKR
jgi:hypothetical protein